MNNNVLKTWRELTVKQAQQVHDDFPHRDDDENYLYEVNAATEKVTDVYRMGRMDRVKAGRAAR